MDRPTAAAGITPGSQIMCAFKLLAGRDGSADRPMDHTPCSHSCSPSTRLRLEDDRRLASDGDGLKTRNDLKAKDSLHAQRSSLGGRSGCLTVEGRAAGGSSAHVEG